MQNELCLFWTIKVIGMFSKVLPICYLVACIGFKHTQYQYLDTCSAGQWLQCSAATVAFHVVTSAVNRNCATENVACLDWSRLAIRILNPHITD